MQNTTFKYTISLQGNDMDVKAAKALKKDDKLQPKRVWDEYDTY